MFNVSNKTTPFSAERRELYQLLLKKKGIGDTQVRAIPRRTKLSPCPTSFAQQRLYFLDQLEPGNSAYSISVVLRLKGALNVPALEASLAEIVRRHEILRTTFQTIDGQPCQIIAPAPTLPWSVVDLLEIPETERDARVQHLVMKNVQRPFDLVHGSLFRALLVCLSELEYTLVVAMHHIVCDGWSMEVLFRELTELYEAFSNGTPCPLPELPIQYADFAVWQREWMQGEVLEKLLAYWKKHLGNKMSILELPTDRPRPAVHSFRGAHQSLVVSKALAESLKNLSHREGSTLFMTLLAAFNALLYRYTGQEDIAVGTPIANRNSTEIEGLIGFFVNMLVLQTTLSDNLSFRELLKRVREATLSAYDHQDLPFEKLVEVLQPERDLSRTPLFQVVFGLQTASMGVWKPSGLAVEFWDMDAQTAKFDLVLFMVDTGDGLLGLWEYNTDLFDATTIQRMSEHFQTLLYGIVSNPDERVRDMPILTERERYQLLVEWNKTRRDGLQDQCIHHLFEARVEQTPDAVAVVFGDQHLTYSDLNRRANQLAHYLQKLGVGPEVPVGICVERSLEMVVGLFAILKAGGAYVPLDPTYPKERLIFMLQDAATPVLLTQSWLLEGLPAPVSYMIFLDKDWKSIEQESESKPVSKVEADNLAYIIFTSGSTGIPKGVVVRHRSVVNLIDWVNTTFQIGPSDRVLFVTSFCFDLSVYDIFGLLAAGGSIRVPHESDLRNSERLLYLLCNGAITLWDSAPAVLQQLVPFFSLVKSDQIVDHLRLVFLSGDWIPVKLPDAVRTTFSSAQVISLGGATEATIWSNYYAIGKVESSWLSIPYGKPIQNAQYYVLDSDLNPCPIGIPGNLHIGGDCLAWGYANRPDLTAEKFIPDPFSNRVGGRLYKTGDRARYLADGNLEFLGRIDQQVKIRGFRVELQEIETVLSQHPKLQTIAVLAQADRLGDKRLVAYIVPTEGQEPTASELRRFVREKLPEYMVPSSFVKLKALPLTQNGKIDRLSLPPPQGLRQDLEVEFIGPRNQIEHTITRIWEEVLQVDRVGVNDNFFELGGHSLLVTQLALRLRERLKIDLPLRLLFEMPTVAELAQNIETLLRVAVDLRATAKRDGYEVWEL